MGRVGGKGSPSRVIFWQVFRARKLAQNVGPFPPAWHGQKPWVEPVFGVVVFPLVSVWVSPVPGGAWLPFSGLCSAWGAIRFPKTCSRPQRRL